MVRMAFKTSSVSSEDDLFFMREALKEAVKSSLKGEVPVGAVLVFENQIIARAHNLVETSQDASMHAEMLCLKQGAKYFNNWRLLKTTLYCTLEPCAMCAGALLNHRIERLVWAAPDLRQGAHGSWVNLFEQDHPIHAIAVTKGILEQEAGRVLRDFFKARRKCCAGS